MMTLELSASDAPNCGVTYERNLTTLAKAKAKTNETFIVQVSLTIVTNDHQNMFIVQASGCYRSHIEDDLFRIHKTILSHSPGANPIKLFTVVIY
jgi:hypothetical protein